MKALAVIFLVAVVAGFTHAQRVSTLRPGKLEPISHVPDFVAADMAVDSTAADSIRITSYDKPLRSLRETFFVTNQSATDTVVRLVLSLTYLSVSDSVMLHSRDASIACEIPPLQTRQLYLIAWDRQYTYYSEHTRIKPTGTRAVPYTTRIKVNGATLRKTRQ